MSEVLLHTRLRELEEELKVEREVRTKYEKDLAVLRLDIDDLDVQLYEAKSARDREIESSKRLKQELADLKHKMESHNAENEESFAFLKRKHQDTISEISVHMEALSKAKLKYEKDNKNFLHQIEELRNENECLARAKSHALATIRDLETKQAESQQRTDELIKQLNELSDFKGKISKEHSDNYRRTANMELELQQYTINNKRLTQELDDLKMQLENELLEKNTLENKLKNLQLDFDNTSSHLEEESEARLELQKQLTRIQEEFKSNRSNIEKECSLRIDEIEDARRRLNLRYMEIQEQLTEALSKYSNTEKARLRIQGQFESLSNDYEKAKKKAEDSVKHEKQLEKENEELKIKLNLANSDLDAAFNSSRHHASELSKYKHLSDQLTEQLDNVQKDKRKVSDEIEATSIQFQEIQGKFLDLERKYKLIESDRNQLQNELDDVKDQLQMELNRNLVLQSQMDKLKIDLEKKLADKEDEYDMHRTAHRRQLEALQAQLEENESRVKGESNTLKKKYQAEVEEAMTKYESAKKAKSDAETQQKKLQQANKELMDKLVEEQNMHDTSRDQLFSAEKRASTYRAELEESKALLERIEKVKKTLDLEYHDLEEKLNEVQASLNRAIAEKKKFEADAATASDELQEVKYELRTADEKIRNLNTALVKKEEELRHERELYSELESTKKSYEQQLRDVQARIDEADEIARREAKRINAKLETRLVQLEAELDLEKCKEQEFIKELRRLEKRNKDLIEQNSEEQARLLSLGDAYEKLQDKMRKYKGQIEGAEELAAENLSKYKKLQRELEDAEDRAENMAKQFIRAASVNRTAVVENYDSDYGESDSYSSFSKPYSYSKSSSTVALAASSHHHNDDYQETISGPKSTRSWKSKYKTLDIDDDDIVIQPRTNYSKYSSNIYSNLTYQIKSKAWRAENSAPSRTDRARSVFTLGGNSRNNHNDEFSNRDLPRSKPLNTRSSISRFHDDLNETTAYLNSLKQSRLNQNNNLNNNTNNNNNINSNKKFISNNNNNNIENFKTSKYKSQSPDLDDNDSKRSEIEMRLSLADENSVTPTPENLD
jgi:myosin heavy chain 1/2/3/4/8/13/7B/15